MTRVLALCSAADTTGSVKQFDLALPKLRERFEVERHALPTDVGRLVKEVRPGLLHTLGAEAFRAVREVALKKIRPGLWSLPRWLAAGASAVEPVFGFVPGLTATFSQSEHEREWAARLVPAPMQFSGPVGIEPPTPLAGRGRPEMHILASGGFDAHANLKYLVWAFDALRYAHPRLRLVLLGDGPERNELERFAHTLGLDSERVHFAGFQPNIAPFLRTASQAWCTHTRGGTKFLLEAMASGVPVIAAISPDTERVIRDGLNGRLVPVGRPVEMARVAHALLSSPDEAGSLVVASQTGAARYPVVDLAEALSGAYHTLTSSASPRPE
jgi:glycosyltransferase involved in cell wall biosynthesis